MSRARVAAALLAALAVAAAPRAHAARPYEDQVVRLLVTAQRSDEQLPWLRVPPRQREAMAVVVDGPLLLTTAQMVVDATFIQAEKGGGPGRVPARVRHLDHEINLALLEVADPSFFEGLRPVRPAGEAVPASGLVLARWEGGQLELAESRVAKVRVESGTTSGLEHVFYQVRSDFTAGGWAEPLLCGEALCGITVSQNGDFAQVMPASVVATYLAAARSPETYPGFGSIDLEWQENRDPVFGRWLGMAGAPRGVVVLSVPWGATGCGELRPRDVLLALDGHAIGPDGLYEHPRHGRVGFANIAVEGHRAGDVVTARVSRGGKELDVPLALRSYPAEARLVPWRRPDKPPPYFVAGGLIFRELDRNYLLSFGKNWKAEAPGRLLAHLQLDESAQLPGRRRIVILAGVLPSPYAVGYQQVRDLVVAEVNGRAVATLADVVEGFRSPRKGLHTIRFRPNSERDEIVLDADALAAADEAVRARFGVQEVSRPDPAAPIDLGPLPAR